MIRRTLGVAFAVLGAYYCLLSVRTLAALPRVTTDWIERSGDPDFHYDYIGVMALTAIGAILLGAFGSRTAVKGVHAALGRRESWLALAIGAPFLHWCWFLYRTIGNGLLDRDAQTIADQGNLVRFGTICFGYLAMWLVMRDWRSANGWTNNRSQPISPPL